MKKNAFNANPIQWYEGMFVMPQHFQQNDMLQKNLWHYHFNHLTQHHWGICSILFDESALATGVLRVLSLEGVMQDGTVIFFPYDKRDTLEIDLKTAIKDEDKPKRVYLTLPQSSLNDFSDGDSTTRYKPIEEESSDLNSPDTKITIMRLMPRFSLSADETLPVQHTVIPIAEMMRKNQKFSFTDYVPPSLYLKRTSPIMQKCAESIKGVRDKLVYLSKKIKTQAHTTASFDAQSIWQFDMTRRYLITGLTELEMVLAQGNCKPFTLYQALRRLAGSCAALRWGEPSPVFPDYLHDNCNQAFSSLYRFIFETLDQIEESYRVVPFARKERIFSLPLEDDWLTKTFILGIRTNAQTTEEDMQKWADGAVMASESFIESAQSNRVLGARRKRVQTVSHMKLIPDKGTILYEVTFDARFITKGETLHIFNISDTAEGRPKEIVLYVAMDEETV